MKRFARSNGVAVLESIETPRKAAAVSTLFPCGRGVAPTRAVATVANARAAATARSARCAHDPLPHGERIEARRGPGLNSGPSGFTLVEMLVVLAIAGLLAGLVAPRVLAILSDSKVKASYIQIEAFGSAVDLFALDTGRVPTSAEGLEALLRRPGKVPGWNGPYIKTAIVPRDPWGGAYAYRAPGRAGLYEIAPGGRAAP